MLSPGRHWFSHYMYIKFYLKIYLDLKNKFWQISLYRSNALILSDNLIIVKLIQTFLLASGRFG